MWGRPIVTKVLENLHSVAQRTLGAGIGRERVIVIGYGNTLRSDDGAGQKIAEILGSWQLPEVRSIAVHQLTPELAAILATGQLAIFIDVYEVEQSELVDAVDVRVLPIALDQHHIARIEAGHVADPQGLLYLTELIYSRSPAAWWMLIPAWNFEFGEQISPLSSWGMAQALHHIQRLITPPMHELSIMESTLEIALDYAHREHAEKILQLNLRVGAMSGVVPAALEFAFDACIQGTIAAGAQLQIELVPVVCYCQLCDREFAPPDLIYVCPDCGTISSNILQGRELQLISLEIP
jgi:hydrogenase nickel insertion protein HypA